ncbi:hypothetical protein AR546_18225 [Leptospira interrogans serovar Canicola]|nr:hypothetical protein B2G47_06870 [Leptospira interrogans serovar Canicola]ASV08430.1 hypothetical protein B2G50_03815 [Leptospira interrogans serovar Canicola]OLZ30034.1 hypothetical protein AR546_18225 [Leptospira interrogans serovar Canicola]OMH68205.1 hypothetical protein BW243_06695 [Leptospira interrogans serovar Pomona]POR19503.1 hypothetical protein B0T34_05180 [Leptospira interrogans serovar Canicola]
MQHYVATARSNIEFKRGREPLYIIKFASDSPKYSYVELTLFNESYKLTLVSCKKEVGRNFLKVTVPNNFRIYL